MKLTIVAKNFNMTPDLKEITEKKLSKLDKFFSEDIHGTAVLRKVKSDEIMEVTITLPDGTVMRSEQKTKDFYETVDKVLAQLERQIRKHKTRLQKRYQNNDSIKFAEIPDFEMQSKEEAPKIVREKVFFLKPMSREEAALQMELVTHDFYLFRDSETDKVSVIYKRGDGDYGLIREE
ncbi:MAG: ribosome-associated translation inhibitor RaiA [Ezakiella sp.]|nr:ribosome-associated translation inhibitor RaiA [Ezakiella sp.]MDD7472315.1 ribosome-associated translation inhibitor RaiA [Bacillota bacterium]MDY3923052.1 ribosome-associated translation inhibitor RaiA [Ezakiella sp.]